MRRSMLVPAATLRTVLTAGLIAGLAVLAAGLTTGCATGTPSADTDDADRTHPADRTDRIDRAGGTGAGFAEVLARPAPTADYAWYPETVSAALPSVPYADGGEAHASELATVGRFTGWAAGEPAGPDHEMIDQTFAVD